MRLTAILTALTLLGATPAFSEHVQKYGDAPVTSQHCPFDCSTQRIPTDYCRDWREDGMCFVQDLRVPPDYDARGRYDPERDSRAPYPDRDTRRDNPSVGDAVGNAIDRAVGR